MFLVLFFCCININNFVNAAAPIEISCSVNGAGENSLEFTGDYPNRIIQVVSTISNCNIYIHDVTCGELNISSAVTGNSNITIRNITSTYKQRPTFIHFDRAISDFGFINISEVSHGSLTIDDIFGSALISAVYFDGAITGSSIATSFITISNIYMTNVSCLRNPSVCQLETVHFSATVANASSITFQNVLLSDVNMKSVGSIASSYFGAIVFTGSVTNVVRVSIVDSTFRNIYFDHPLTVNLRFIYFQGSVQSSPSLYTNESKLAISNATLDNVTAKTGGSCFFRMIQFDGATSNYNTLKINSIRATNIVASADPTASGFVAAMLFTGAITSPSNLNSTAFLLQDVILKNVSSSGDTTQMFGFYAGGATTKYFSVRFEDIDAANLVASSATSTSYIRTVEVQKIAASSLTASDAATYFAVRNLALRNASASSNTTTPSVVASVVGFLCQSNLNNYNTVLFSGITLSDLSALSFQATLSAVQFTGSLFAVVDSTSSSLTITNSSMRRVTLPRGQFVYFVYVVTALRYFVSIELSHFAVADVFVNGSSSALNHIVFVNGAISAPSPPSSSFTSITVRDILMSNISLQSTTVSATVFYCGNVITDYQSISFSGIVVTAFNASASSSTNTLSLVSVRLSITAPASNCSNSVFNVTNITVTGASLWSQLAGMASSLSVFALPSSGLLVNYNAVVFKRLRVSDVIMKTASIYFWLINFALDVVAPLPSISGASQLIFFNSSFIVDDIIANNITIRSSGANPYVLQILHLNSLLSNFSTIRSSNIVVSNVDASTTTGVSLVTVQPLLFTTVVPPTYYLTPEPSNLLYKTNKINVFAPSFVVENMTMQNVNASCAMSAQVYFVMFLQEASNFTTMRFKTISGENISANGGTSTGFVQPIFFTTFVNTSSSLGASSSQQTTFIGESMSFRGIKMTGIPASFIIFTFTTHFAGFTDTRFSDVNVSDVMATSSTTTTIYFHNVKNRFNGQSSTSAPTSWSSSLVLEKFSIANTNMRGGSGGIKFSFFSLPSFGMSYDVIRFSDLTMMDLSLSSSTIVQFIPIYFLSSVTAVALENNSFVMERISATRITATSSSTADIAIPLFTDFAVTNFDQIRFDSISVLNVAISAGAGSSNVNGIYFGSAMTARNPTSSAFTVKNCILGNVTSTAGSYSFNFISLYGYLVDYNRVRFNNISATNSNFISSSAGGGSTGRIIWMGSEASAPTPSFASTSSIVFFGISVKNVNLTNNGAANLYLIASNAITNFTTIELSKALVENVTVRGTSASVVVLHCSASFTATKKSASKVSIRDNIVGPAVAAFANSSSNASSAQIDVVELALDVSSYDEVDVTNNRIFGVSTSVAASGATSSARMCDIPDFSNVGNVSVVNNTMSFDTSHVQKGFVSVAMLFVRIEALRDYFGLITSSYGFNLEMRDNSMVISSVEWQNACDPKTCSMLRIDALDCGNSCTNTSQNTTINMNNNNINSPNAINVPSLSLVSFANITNPTGKVYPSTVFDLKNNYLNLTQNNKILSFDVLNSGSSFSLPSVVLMKMECNRWLRGAERAMSNALTYATSSTDVERFFVWICSSRSSSISVSMTQDETASDSHATRDQSKSSSVSLSETKTKVQKKNRTLTNNETESSSITPDLTSSESRIEKRTNTRTSSLPLRKKQKTKTKTLPRPATTFVPLPRPPRSNKTRTETQTLVIVVSPVAVVAPEAASATASIAAAAGGAVGGDVASPTQAARALSLAAIATACANDVVYVPSPPLDEQLPWPQGSLIPQIQISLPNDNPKDSWRKHFRGAILANFVVFPLIILSFVVPLIYGLRFTALQTKVSAKYLFSVKKSKELEERAPDLIADARLFGVILFLFGLGLESATCAFVTLLASPRATSDSFGIDIFLCLLAITIIIAALILLLKVEIGANEKLECVPSDIMFKSDEKSMSDGKRKAARFLLGSLCWTYRGSLDSKDKIEEGKTFFLRNRNLFASNQGPHEENEQNNNNESTLATKANNKINEEANTIARKISVFASFVDCVLTVVAGLIRGLTTAGVLPCETAIILLVISQVIILLWALLIRSSLYPVTKILNVVVSILLFGAALATLVKYKEASTFAVSVAMILSFLGMFIVFIRLLIRRVVGVIVYPKREKIVEEMKQEIQDSQAASLAAPLLEYNNSNNNVEDDDFGDVELVTAPHSPLQGPSEIEINIPVADDGDVDIDLSILMDNNNNNNNNANNHDSHSEQKLEEIIVSDNDNSNNNNSEEEPQEIVTSHQLNDFVINDLPPPMITDDDLYVDLQGSVTNNDYDDDDEEAKQIRKNKLDLAESKDKYESETKEEKLKRLLAELEDDSDLNEALEKRKKMEEEKKRKQTTTKEEQIESLRKIQQSLGRKF